VNPTIIVEYLAKTDKLGKGVQDVSKSGSKAAALTKKAFVPAIAALGAVAVASKKAVDAASGLNEQINANQVTFGASSKAMVDWASKGAKAMGLSTREALTAANAVGNMLATAGIAPAKLAPMSQALVQLGGDMASFFDQDPSEMLDRLRSGLAGEAEPLRRFGVNISDAAVQAKAFTMGLTRPVKDMGKVREAQTRLTLATHAYSKAVKEHGAKSDQAASASLRVDSAERALAKAVKGTTKPLTDAQKVQARYALILDQTKKAQGDFARTGDSVANMQRTNAAESENLAAQFGQALLPATKMLQQWLSKLMAVMSKNPGMVKALTVAVVGLAAAIVVMNLAMAVAAFLTASWALPFLAVVAAVAAVIAIGILLWKNWDAVTAKLSAAWNAMKTVATSAVQAIVGAFQRLWSMVSGLVSRLVAWIRANWQLLVMILGGPIAAAALLIARYWSQITSGAQRAWAAVKSAVSGFVSWFGQQVARVSSIATQIATALRKPGEAATAAKDAVVHAMDAILSKLRSILGKISSAASSVASAIKGPINAVISAWNGISLRVPNFSIGGGSLPGGVKIPKASFGGQTINFPDVPKLAQGGVLTSPTLFLGGEAGREIVAPEGLLREIVGDGGTYNLYLQPRTADAADVAYAFRRLELLRSGR
jgi:hypothetical protein